MWIVREILLRDLLYHYYAYDTHVYLAITLNKTWLDVLEKLEACLAHISAWRRVNMLISNQKK